MRRDLADSAAELSRAGTPYVAATVVRAQHPTSARPGDRALLHSDGRLEGFVGGSCAQSAVVTHGLAALAGGEPVLLRVLPGAPRTVREDGAVTVANPCLSGGALEIFLEPRLPAPRMLVVGDTPVGHALADLGGYLGLDVELADGESVQPAPADAAVVVASHGRGEEPALARALRAGVPYVALVASDRRAAAVLASLDVDDDLRKLVHSPAGVAIGARTPAEIALSILAELVAERAERAGAPSAAASAGIEALAGPGDGSAPAVDPVCGMTVPVTAGAPNVQRGGTTAYFCGETCRRAFLDDPVSYGA